MFYGPIVGGLITQNLSFKWAAAVQGGLAFLGVSMIFVQCSERERGIESVKVAETRKIPVYSL